MTTIKPYSPNVLQQNRTQKPKAPAFGMKMHLSLNALRASTEMLGGSRNIVIPEQRHHSVLAKLNDILGKMTKAFEEGGLGKVYASQAKENPNRQKLTGEGLGSFNVYAPIRGNQPQGPLDMPDKIIHYQELKPEDPGFKKTIDALELAGTPTSLDRTYTVEPEKEGEADVLKSLRNGILALVEKTKTAKQSQEEAALTAKAAKDNRILDILP